MIQTLNGLRILNTRPLNQAKPLSKLINDAGGIAIECPTLEIKAVNKIWLKSLPNLNEVNLAIFVSANAVWHCFNQLNLNNIQWPSHIKVIAIGHGSAKALCEFDINVDNVPVKADSEHLLSLNILKQLKNQTVLLFKGEGGRQLIENSLLERGAKLIILNVYKRFMPQVNPEFINSLWRDNLVDIILLTSEQSIDNFFKLISPAGHQWIQDKPCLVISERLAQSAANFGIKKILISHPDKMLNTLFDYYQGLLHGRDH